MHSSLQRRWRIGMLLRWASLFGLAVTIFGLSHLPDNQFQILSYETISRQLHELADSYPNLAKLYSAQERYNLLSPGSCSEDGSVACQQWVLHISDHSSLEADPERPEVFFSGCLHGDEQVGPTSVMEAAKLMIYAAMCHADAAAKECDDEVLRASPESVPWLARLALSRSTVIMPMTNSIGYYTSQRAENGLDPNRDFPYHQTPDKCMTTVTARAVNEVWREHAFQLAVTFHGGMVAMAYEWGSPDHPHRKDKSGSDWQDTSPDHAAQKELTGGLSLFAGSFKAEGKTFEAYPTGRMNELVYPVTGGMEDWAYAGSWGDAMGVCDPEPNGGYPIEKTTYNSATLRALNILVEASDIKRPPESLLGSRQGLLEHVPSVEKHANGHVARNVRLALMVVDLVEPYVQWTPLQIDKKPNSGARVVVVDENMGLDLEWTVGGAFTVDATQLVWGPWPEDSDSLTREDWEDLAQANVQNRSPAQSGRTRWSSGRTGKYHGREGGEERPGRETIFRARLDLGEPSEGSVGLRITGDKLAGSGDGQDSDAHPAAVFVMAAASVDQAWGSRLVKGWPDIGPQSHFVNARTSAKWFQENNGHIVRGRLEWLSAPLKVTAPSRPPVSTAARLPEEHSEPKDKGDEADKGDWGGGYGGDTTVPPFEWVMGKAGEERTTPLAKPVVVATGLVLVLASLIAAGLLARAGGRRRRAGDIGAASRTTQGWLRAGMGAPTLYPETGGTSPARRAIRPSNTASNPGDILSRRRSQESPLTDSHGATVAHRQFGSRERRGLLSPGGDQTP